MGLTIYRVVQESLTNVLKHGDQVSKVVVALDYECPFVGLSVRNDGGTGRAALERSRASRHAGAGRRVRGDADGRSPCRRWLGGGHPLSCRRGSDRVTIRVLLVDDQALLRKGFRMVLEEEGDIDVVGEAADGDEAVSKSAAYRPDVVLMDVRMPGMDGIEATARIVSGASASKVLILTTFDLDEYAFAGLRAGASGFLLKDVPRPSWSRPSGRWPWGMPWSPPG